MKRKKGESAALHCGRCRWTTELPMSETEQSTVVPCAHCGEPLYWHLCQLCGLRYMGEAAPRCPSCDDPSLDELEYV